MKFDLHLHSCNSFDSFSSVEKVIKYAKKQGLSGIAITDHEKILSDEYIERYTDRNFWLIKGEEVYTEIGDIVGLFLSGPLKERSAARLVDEIHSQGGLAILVHPFKRTKSTYPEKILTLLDAVEVANSRWRDLSSIANNQKVNNLLAQVRGRSAGSDAHFLFEIGRAHLVTPCLSTQEELKQVIRTGTGRVVFKQSSEWLDILSQGVKFLKHPSFKQFLRLVYYSGRNFIFPNRRDNVE